MKHTQSKYLKVRSALIFFIVFFRWSLLQLEGHIERTQEVDLAKFCGSFICFIYFNWLKSAVPCSTVLFFILFIRKCRKLAMQLRLISSRSQFVKLQLQKVVKSFSGNTKSPLTVIPVTEKSKVYTAYLENQEEPFSST